MTDYKEKYGPWALVTGASSGIGQEFARQLAALGLNVAVAARRKERLDSLAVEIESQYNVQARAIAIDLTARDVQRSVDEATNDLEIGLLVNNAGAGIPGAFLKQEVEGFQRIVQLNVNAPMQLAHTFGRKMARRGRGGIIFVSSIAGYMGSPYMANYAATKSYLLSLGSALHVELKPRGVDVLVVSPGPTRTEMVDMVGMNEDNVPMGWMDASQVAQAGLRALGHKPELVPGGMNRMMTFLATRIIPRQASLTMFGNMMSRAMDPSIL